MFRDIIFHNEFIMIHAKSEIPLVRSYDIVRSAISMTSVRASNRKINTAVHIIYIYIYTSM